MNSRIDLNLFYVAESLFRTLNVSKTSKELGLSQSAVSHALQRLRDQMGDPLFVRGSKGMRPTKKALEIKDAVLGFVSDARKLASTNEVFDPKSQTARIVIATTDYVEVLLMPKIIKALKTQAPNVQISIRPTGGDLPKQELENGTYDLAIAGFYEKLPEGFYQTSFLTDEFAIGYRKDHTNLKGKVSLEEYLEQEHVLITLQGDFKDKLSQKLGKNGPLRKIRYGSYSFSGPAWSVAQTDLVLTAPNRLLQEYKKFFPIIVQPPPIQLPQLQLKMVWHSVSHKDPVRKWFREFLKTMVANI